MAETSARLLRLLSLLQTRRDWTGAELAERLGVTPRTVRRDVDRLRRIGYPVDAARGLDGGYRLGNGAELPPLLLEDDEAVAIAVGLRGAAAGAVDGIEESSVRALAKLEGILPDRVRRKVSAIGAATVALPHRGPAVDGGLLAALSAACRDRDRLAFAYRAGDGTSTRRTVEPIKLGHAGLRWYLLAFDTGREDWRTFRVDRIAGEPAAVGRFPRRPEPEGGAAAYLQRALTQGARADRGPVAVVRLTAPHARVVARVSSYGEATPDGPGATLLRVSSGSPEWLAAWLAIVAGELGAELELVEGDELRAALAALAARAAAAVAAA